MLSDGSTAAVIITIDAVAIAEIGTIENDFLATVRGQLEQELRVKPANVLVNASHCHGIVCNDVAGADGPGGEAGVAEHGAGPRRQPAAATRTGSWKIAGSSSRDGREADNRRAYSLPPDEEVAGVGPVDPQIGVLRLDKENGETLAVVYNFACHPIQGIPGGSIHSADLAGFASKVIEDNLSDGAVALFLQGCAGDINPSCTRTSSRPRDAERLGNMLGLSTLKAVRKIQSRETAKLHVLSETIELPRADFAPASLR